MAKTYAEGDKYPPIHPGEILSEEFLKPLKMSQYKLAKSIGVDPRRINAIVQGKRAITAETAIKLSQFFGTSAQLWLGLQIDYDLDVAMDKMGVTFSRYSDIPVTESEREADLPPTRRSPVAPTAGR